MCFGYLTVYVEPSIVEQYELISFAISFMTIET